MDEGESGGGGEHCHGTTFRSEIINSSIVAFDAAHEASCCWPVWHRFHSVEYGGLFRFNLPLELEFGLAPLRYGASRVSGVSLCAMHHYSRMDGLVPTPSSLTFTRALFSRWLLCGRRRGLLFFCLLVAQCQLPFAPHLPFVR